MSTSNDIASLFARFGGRAENYQEIGREEKAQVSQQRWPLLASVGQAKAVHPPSVNAGAFRRGNNIHRQPTIRAQAPQAAPQPQPQQPPSPAMAPTPPQPQAKPAATGSGVRFMAGGMGARQPAAAVAPQVLPETRKPAEAVSTTPLQQTFARLQQAAEPSTPAPAPAKAAPPSSQVNTLFRRLGGQ